jgi:hypothetical protein
MSEASSMASSNPYEGSVSSPSDQSFHSATEHKTSAEPPLPPPPARPPPALPRPQVPERSAPPVPPSLPSPPVAPWAPPLRPRRDGAEEDEEFRRRGRDSRDEQFSPSSDADQWDDRPSSVDHSRRYHPDSPRSGSSDDLRREGRPPSSSNSWTDHDSDSDRRGPYTEASVDYTDPDGTPRRRSFTMLPNGKHRESDVPLRLEESDEDEFGVGTDAETYRPAQRLKRELKPTLRSAGNDRGKEISDGDDEQSVSAAW